MPGCEGSEGPRYSPVRYGDHLLAKISAFTEFRTLFVDGKLRKGFEPA